MWGRVSDACAALGGAFFLVSALCGATCQVSYCSDDCDPCLQTCPCHNRTCTAGLQMDFERAHRLAAWRLSGGIDSQGNEIRTYADILGLSVRRAYGLEELGTQDLRRFAEGVIQVNHDLLDTPRGLGGWVFDAVDVFETAEVVSFHHEVATTAGTRDVEGSGLSFLFDPRGNLLEIDQLLPSTL